MSGTSLSHATTCVFGRGFLSSETTFVSSKNTATLQWLRWASSVSTPCRQRQLPAGEFCKQQLFQRRPRELAESPPLLDRHEHSGFLSSSRDHLRPLAHTGFQELAETSLCKLNWPVSFAHTVS